jgi:uncharacterized caspase-like protein
MRAVAAIVLAFWAALFFNGTAFAEKRVALVIGNSAYQNVSRLANPVNDSDAMSATFNDAGFDVVDLKRDLKANEMRRALRDFSDKVRDADVAIVYFAGHGIEIDGINYVIPVDATLERDIDAFDEAIPLDRLLTVIEPAKKLRLVILDACRDNPFNKIMKRTSAARVIGRGLAKVEPTSPNTLIAFAAKAGSTASDGDSKNSPFTAALVRHLPKPGLDLRRAFGLARDDVLKATNNKQEPFIYGSLGGDDVALVPALTPPPLSVADPNASVRRDYEFAERIGTREAWDFYLSTYPDGFYAKLAQAQRNKLAAEEVRMAATEKARLAAEEQARLAAEGAKISEQAKAASQAKAAEEARMIAEKKKAIEDAKVAEIAAEKAKAAEEAEATQERIAVAKKTLEAAKAAEVERAKAAAQAKAEEEAKLATVKSKTTDEKKNRDNEAIGQLAALAPPQQAGEVLAKPDNTAADIARLLQIELRRVGCNTGAVDGNWDVAAQRSLLLFNKNAQTKFDVKVASLDALDAARSKTARVCPLICDYGYEPVGENCVRISCKQGYRIGDDNTCEKIEFKRPVSKRESSPELQPQRPTSKPTASASAGGTCKNWLAICSSRPRSTPSICSKKYSDCLGSGCWTEGVSYGGAEHCNLKR